MPVLPPSTSPPYDTGEYVLQLARAIVDDAGLTIAGNLLSDTQPYTLVLLNAAIRDVQQDLANNGAETFPAEVVLTGLPVVGSTDPAVQCWISYQNFWDGENSWTAPVLPADLLYPTRMWERTTASQSIFIDMYPTNDGLPSRPKTAFLQQWEWRDDRIMLIGSTQVEDVRMRYSRFIPDQSNFADQIPLIRCSSALAYSIAYKYATGRGGDAAGSLLVAYNQEIQKIVLRTTRKTQRNNNRRIPYGGGQPNFPNWGWSG